MAKREPDSKAVREARIELRAIVADLRAVKARTLALSHRLKLAAKTGEVVGRAEGRPYTVEDWFAGTLRGDMREGAFHDALKELSQEVNADHRHMAKFHVVETLEGELV